MEQQDNKAPLAPEQSPARPTIESCPIFDLQTQLLIARGDVEHMTDKQRECYAQYKAWEERTREARAAADAWDKAEREKRRQENRLRAEKAATAAAEYWQRVREMERAEEAEKGTLAGFVRKLNSEQAAAHTPRLTCSIEEATQYLTAAYEVEVKRRGQIMMHDEYTQTVIADVARWMVTHQKPGLVLRGYIGVGKTTMLKAMGSCLKHLADTPMTIVDAREIAEKRKEGSPEFDTYCRCRLLGIDDLGTEPLVVKQYGNDIPPLAEVIAKRYDGRLSTIVTTNLVVKMVEGKQVDELQEVYGDRTFDRIKELCNMLYYSGQQQSYRR